MLTTKELVEGSKVVVTRVIPQAYNESGYEKAEISYVEQFMERVGTVISIDQDPQHPIKVQFKILSRRKGKSPDTCRFSFFELEAVDVEV